jgi:hypothetical protein
VAKGHPPIRAVTTLADAGLRDEDAADYN